MQKEWKQNIPRKGLMQFWLWLDKRIVSKKYGLTRKQNLLECKNLFKAEGIQIYSTMSETKAGYAERTIRSLKVLLYRYMEDNGYKYIHKLTQFVTTLNSRRNCSKEFRLFVTSVQQTTPRIQKTQVQKWRQSSHLEVWHNLYTV